MVLLDNERCSKHQALIISALRLDSGTVPTVAQYIRVVEIIRWLGNKGAIVVARMLPASPVPGLLLSCLYMVNKDAASADVHVAGRVLHPHWIESSLPGLWKATCTRLHEGLCKRPPDAALSSILPTFVVDVNRQCIITPPRNCSYVALSYVWGNQVTLQSKRDNITRLQRTGSLSPEPSGAPKIAKTIRDAMGITRLLDERYLWVDSLCIVQDDGIQKRDEIDNMAAIYANASVTILAVQGTNANSGLHGFRGISAPRSCNQSVHCLKGRTIVQHPVEENSLEVATSKSAWETRAWTYQEDMFSRRRLVFNGDSIRWECAGDIWREHVDASPKATGPADGAGIDQAIFQHSLPDLSKLQIVLRGYNKRDFTYPEDALRAFAGILVSLNTSFPGGFLSGLPISLFDVALLWQPCKKMVRRTPKDSKHLLQLPSWSWAGWSGEIEFDNESALDFVRDNLDNIKCRRERRIIRARSWKFHETPQSTGQSIHATILDNKDMFLAGRVDSLPGWSRHHVSERPDPFYEPPDPRASRPTSFYRHEAHPGQEFWYPIPLLQKPICNLVMPFISSWTRRTWLFACEKMQKTSGYSPVLCLRSKNGTWAGTLQPHHGLDTSGNGLQDANSPLELIEIAQGFCRDATSPWPGIDEIRHPERPRGGLWYEYYWVMWVGWKGNVAHRRGLGRVHKAFWEQNRGEEFALMLN